MKIICIFPNDESTDFLLPIYDSLSTLDSFTGYRNLLEQGEIDLVIKDILSSESGSVIIFLGHGASHCIYRCDRTPLFDKHNFNIFQNKRIFLFSCRSSEFIKDNKNTHLIEYIGFGNMVTDIAEVLEERDVDSNAYPDIDEGIIDAYKKILVQILSLNLKGTLEQNISFRDLYFQIKLLLNKYIAKTLKEKKHSNYKALTDLLYYTKCDMIN
ncbi:MAG: hypothetical protein PHC34_12920 [Candidatus Gastranaerophilales bacterium]|nr:hypothetical protein [Candidatus Gastranaerophilales bacterium]